MAAVIRGVFGAGSGFRAGWCFAGGGGSLLFFKSLLVVLAGFFILVGDWALKYYFKEF